MTAPVPLTEAERETLLAAVQNWCADDAEDAEIIHTVERILADRLPETTTELCGYSRDGLVCIHAKGHGVPDGENLGRHYLVTPSALPVATTVTEWGVAIPGRPVPLITTDRYGAEWYARTLEGDILGHRERTHYADHVGPWEQVAE